MGWASAVSAAHAQAADCGGGGGDDRFPLRECGRIAPRLVARSDLSDRRRRLGARFPPHASSASAARLARLREATVATHGGRAVSDANTRETTAETTAAQAAAAAQAAIEARPQGGADGVVAMPAVPVRER